MKIKKNAKAISHKITKTACKTASAVSKFAGKNVTVAGVALGAAMGAVATGWAFNEGYTHGTVSAAFNGNYEMDD